MTDQISGKLTIAAGPFQEAFERLRDVLPRRSIKTAELVLRYSDNNLFLEGPGAAVEVPATGHWAGHARVSAAFTRLLATSLPAGDPLILEYNDGYLVLRGTTTMRFKAAWEDISPKRLDVALDLSDTELLVLLKRETPEAIVSSGLGKSVHQAERRFQHAIDRVFELLAPYSLRREDVERVIRELITRS